MLCEIHLYKSPWGIPRVLLVFWRTCFLQQRTFSVVLHPCQPRVTGPALVWDVLWFHSYTHCFWRSHSLKWWKQSILEQNYKGQHINCCFRVPFSWVFLIPLGLNVILISLLWLGCWDRCFPLSVYGSAACFTNLPGCKDPAELFKFSFIQLKRACPFP